MLGSSDRVAEWGEEGLKVRSKGGRCGEARPTGAAREVAAHHAHMTAHMVTTPPQKGKICQPWLFLWWPVPGLDAPAVSHPAPQRHPTLVRARRCRGARHHQADVSPTCWGLRSPDRLNGAYQALVGRAASYSRQLCLQLGSREGRQRGTWGRGLRGPHDCSTNDQRPPGPPVRSPIPCMPSLLVLTNHNTPRVALRGCGLYAPRKLHQWCIDCPASTTCLRLPYILRGHMCKRSQRKARTLDPTCIHINHSTCSHRQDG